MPAPRRAARIAPLAAALLAGACADAPTGPGGPRLSLAAAYVGPDPILFVHGWNSNAGIWATMITRLKAEGYTDAQLHAWSYNTAQSNATTAQSIQRKVDSIRAATGAPKVDLVTHSMGALSARHYVRTLGGTTTVDAWISLGGPNYGTNTAWLCSQTACIEMRPGSRFLAALNKSDPTPGSAVRYATWWSSCDQVVQPQTSTILTGATNTQTACLTHSALYQDATIHAQVRAWLGGSAALLAHVTPPWTPSSAPATP